MFSRPGLISLSLILVLLAGWLFSDDLEKPDLAGVIRNIQLTLSQLQSDMKDLKSSVKDLSRAAKKNKGARPGEIPLAGPANPVPAWQRQQEAYERGRRFEEQKRWGEAIEAFTQAIELDGKNDAAFLHRGICRLGLGDQAGAVADLTHSLSIQPNNSRAYATRASALGEEGQTAAGLADANEAIRRDGQNADYLLLRASLHQRAGEAQPAIDDYTQAIAVAPQSEKAYLGRAALLRAQGQLPAALKDCYKAIELNSGDPAAYLCRAQFYLASGAAQPAIEDINQAILNGQNPTQIASLLGTAHDMLQTKKETAEQPQPVPPPANPAPAPTPAPPVTVAAATPPPAAAPPVPPSALAPPRYALATPSTPASPAPATPAPRPSTPPAAKNLPARANQPAARAAVREQAAPKNANANDLYRKAHELSLQERFADALPLFNQAIQLDPNLTLALNGRCYAHLRLLQYDLAIADCSAAIRLNASYANAYQNRGVARFRSGDKPGAREDFRRVAELQPVAQAPNSKTVQRP